MLKKISIIIITIMLGLSLSLTRPQKTEALALTLTLATVAVLMVGAGYIFLEEPTEALLQSVYDGLSETRKALFGELVYDSTNGIITGEKDVIQELLYGILTQLPFGKFGSDKIAHLYESGLEANLLINLALHQTYLDYKTYYFVPNLTGSAMRLYNYQGAFAITYRGQNLYSSPPQLATNMKTYWTFELVNNLYYMRENLVCFTKCYVGALNTILEAGVVHTFSNISLATGYATIALTQSQFEQVIDMNKVDLLLSDLAIPAPLGSDWTVGDNHGPEDVYLGEDDWRFTGPNDVTLGGIGAALGGLWGSLDIPSVRMPDIPNPNLDPTIPMWPDIVDSVGDFAGDVADWIGDTVGGLGTDIGDALAGVGGALAGLIGWLGNLLKQIYDGLGLILSFLGTMLSSLLAALLALGTFIVDGISGLFEFDKTAWDTHLENLRTVIIAKVPCMTETTAAINQIMETSGTEYYYSVTLLGYNYSMPMSTIFAGFENMSTFIKMFFSFGLWFAFIKGMVRRISTFLSGSGTQSDGGEA